VPSERVHGGRPSALATHAALAVVQMAFAAGAVEGKLALKDVVDGGAGVGPLALAMARMVGGALFFQGLVRMRGPLARLSWNEHARIAGLAVLGIVLNQTLFLVGLRMTTAFSASLLGATIPVFTAGLALALRLERASVRTALGLVFAAGGVVWLTGVGRVDVGALVIGVNCFSYSLYIVFSKRVIERVGALTLVAWIFTWGAVLFAPAGVVPLARGVVSWGGQAWVLVAVILAVPTIVAYLANAWALGRSGPTLVTIYICLQPLLAAVLQWVQLGVPLTGRAVGAGVLILLGVALVASRYSPIGSRAGPTTRMTA
jgi:drug/metabolite transporter (DMT)-like permease